MEALHIVVVVGQSLGLWALLPWALGQIYSTRYVLYPMEWALNPIRKGLVTYIIFMLLFQPWTYLVILVIIVADRFHLHKIKAVKLPA